MRRTIQYVIAITLLILVSCDFGPRKPEASLIGQNLIFDQPITTNCHASTLVEHAPNQLMAAWFGGSYEGAKDVGIYLSAYNGTSWSRPSCLIKPLHTQNDTLPCWNPVLFKSKSNGLYLFYKVGKNPREWFGAMVISTDNGDTWSKPKYLPKGILGPIRNKPIEIKPGVILCGSSTENIKNNKWEVHVERFTELNGEWEKIPVDNPKDFDIIQPTFLVHEDGLLQILCRSKHNKLISSWSKDGGNTWTITDSINVINSNSGIDALTIGQNNYLLVNNPLPQGANWFNGRNVLDVEYSSDGVNWEKLFDLENKETGEYSYPAIIQTADRKIHISYTYDREYIKHVIFELRTEL